MLSIFPRALAYTILILLYTAILGYTLNFRQEQSLLLKNATSY